MAKVDLQVGAGGYGARFKGVSDKIKETGNIRRERRDMGEATWARLQPIAGSYNICTASISSSRRSGRRFGVRTMIRTCYALALSVLLAPGAAHADPITPKGMRLLRILDSMGVDHKWQPFSKVNWQTGLPLAEQPSNYRGTHCAGFVDAVAQKLGVPINSPSDPQVNPSADEQTEWLASAGAAVGWHRLDGPVAAQFAANHGEFVIAALDDSPRIGHSAIVRPANKNEADILADGPQETQAGGVNERNTDVADGFKRHSNPLTRIQYFGHAW